MDMTPFQRPAFLASHTPFNPYAFDMNTSQGFAYPPQSTPYSQSMPQEYTSHETRPASPHNSEPVEDDSGQNEIKGNSCRPDLGVCRLPETAEQVMRLARAVSPKFAIHVTCGCGAHIQFSNKDD